MEKVGKYAFIAGLVICALAGFGLEATWVPWVLAVLGLVVGFLNIGDKEVSTFLLASVALILSASAMVGLPFVGGVLTTILAYLIVFIGPAVLVVSLKGLLATARE
ncbi:MAG: hypothetical protein PVJ64_15985 [Gemmatimonadales bacterium]|jgi:hypothetical protein